MNHHRSSRPFAVGLLALSTLLAACSAAAAPSASAPPVSAPPETPVSAPPVDPSGSGSLPGGDLGGDGDLVVPKPGQLDVRDVPADELAARVDGTSIIVTATWTSGVEPCNVLDHVFVEAGAGSYAITLREGHGPEEVMCIAIAKLHKTEITIPNVAPGTYQISDATGGAAPIEVTVG